MQVAKIMSTPVARATRALIGMILIYVGYANIDGLGAVLVIIFGVVLVLSGLLNFCAISKLVGGPFMGKDVK